MHRPEQVVQINIVRYLRKRGFLFSAPDAGVNVSSVRTRSILKMMGRNAGVADLVVWVPNGTVCIEVKRPKMMKTSEKTGRMIIDDQGGKQSKEQKEFEQTVSGIKGHSYIVVSSVEEVISYFNQKNIFPK